MIFTLISSEGVLQAITVITNPRPSGQLWATIVLVAMTSLVAVMRVILIVTGHDGDELTTALFTALVGASVSALVAMHLGAG